MLNQKMKIEDAKQALTDMLSMINEPSTKEFLDRCVNEANGDLPKVMELVIPKIMEIQGIVMQQFGFEASDKGFEEFASSLKSCEDQCDEVKQLGEEFKGILQTLAKTKTTTAAAKKDDVVQDSDKKKEISENGAEKSLNDQVGTE
eukprot:g5779.t1